MAPGGDLTFSARAAGLGACRKWRASAQPLFKSSLVRMDSSVALSGEECLAISFVEFNEHSLDGDDLSLR